MEVNIRELEDTGRDPNCCVFCEWEHKRNILSQVEERYHEEENPDQAEEFKKFLDEAHEAILDVGDRCVDYVREYMRQVITHREMN